jgi:hypothetical protein
MQWLDQSQKTKETFEDLYTKARVFAGIGKYADAIAAAERVLQTPKLATQAPTRTSLPISKSLACETRPIPDVSLISR